MLKAVLAEILNNMCFQVGNEMKELISRGLDQSGYIICNISVDKVNRKFRPVLDDTVERLVSSLGEKLHSIYLYGSIGRGEAVYGQSDLDLSVITHEKLNKEKSQALAGIERDICKKHDSISKLELDMGTLKSVKNNEYEWQFWLKHFCVCIWGVDLRDKINLYKPSLAVGLEMNIDISDKLNECKRELSGKNAAIIGKSIARKILRTHYSLICEKDNSFYNDIDLIAETLMRYYKSKTEEIGCALSMAKGSNVDERSVSALVSGYGKFVENELAAQRGT